MPTGSLPGLQYDQQWLGARELLHSKEGPSQQQEDIGKWFGTN